LIAWKNWTRHGLSNFQKHSNQWKTPQGVFFNAILFLKTLDNGKTICYNVVNPNLKGGYTMETNENTIVKLWYCDTYSDDECGAELNDFTFYDVFTTLDMRKDVYNLFGVNDSIVRERIFEELAKIMQVDYDYIYTQWLL